jgi:hypothetical protein
MATTIATGFPRRAMICGRCCASSTTRDNSAFAEAMLQVCPRFDMVIRVGSATISGKVWRRRTSR